MIMLKTTSKHERVEIAVTLIQDLINYTLEIWGDNPENLTTYAWGWRSEHEVGNNHGNEFYYADEVIKILVGLELNWHLSLAKNADGELTPTIHFF